MWPFRSRASDLPSHLPVVLPRPDGTGWPDESWVGRPSFAANTLYEMGVRHAYDPEAHAVGDRLVDDLLPHVETGVAAADEPYLRKTFLTAARIGAGVGIVSRSGAAADPATVDRRTAGALWQARRKLPAMRHDWSTLAGYFLLAGYHVALTGPALLDRLVEDVEPGGA